MTDKNDPLKEGIDYIIDTNGRWVFTEKFLLQRGHCCESACQNCPYDYSSKVDPNIPSELQKPWENETIEVYDGLIDEE
ncbi:DUF5522 domain-containing protein [Bacteriovoracaceae bacterium]|nr:DUF5522 domain-containing protein [Bacteriovoracaceae bacterium]